MKRKDILPVLLTGALSASTFANTLSVFAQEEQPQEINRGEVSETNAEQVNEPVSTEETEITVNMDNDSQNTLTEQLKESEESNETSNSISTNNTSKIESIESKQELKLDDKQTQNVVNVTINGTTIGYTNINDAFAACNGQTATITLLDNVTSTNEIVVNNANITFVGGDYQLYSRGKFIHINNSTFTLESGYINHDGLFALEINSGSKLIMNGGKVNCLFLSQNATCDLHGGVIENLDNYSGTINVYGGTIQNFNNNWGSTNYYYTSPTPTYNVSTTKNTITVTLINYDSKYGFVGYAISKDGESPNGWQQTDQSTIEFTSLESYQKYDIFLYYKGKGNYLESEDTTFTVSTKKDISEILDQLFQPTGLTAVYDQTLSDVKLPTGWNWVNPNTVLNETDGLLIPGEPLGLGEFEFPAQLDVSQYDSEYDFSKEQGYDPDHHVLKRNLTVLVSAKQNNISLKEGVKLAKKYDGYPFIFTEDDIQKDIDVGTVTFDYHEEKINGAGNTHWSKLTEAPTKAGHYRVTIYYDGGTWYSSSFIQEEFTIFKADTILSFIQTNIDKTYDGKKAFVSTDQKGNSNSRVLTWYQLNEDGTETQLSSAPVNVGKYKVVATVDPNENYNGAQTEMTFEITKAVPSYALPSGLTMKQGEALSSLALPEGFTWKDGTQKADVLGTHTFKATYTPTDTTNYEIVDVDIPVEVVSATKPENQAPVINAKDQTLAVGDKFDPMKGVTATDQEDGDLTDKIVITKNTVDTSKTGKYTVDYEVTDNGGIRVRKTIVVTVKEKSTEQTTTTTDSKKTNGTKTSVGLGIGLFTSLAGASAVGAGILSVLKKRNGK